MKLIRALLGLLGFGLAAWGVSLLLPTLGNRPIPLLGWLLGGPILHDAVFAIVVIGVAALLRRVLPRAFRGPVAIALLLTVLLVVLAIPLLWRTYGEVVNPGLHDRAVVPGLLVTLAVIWIAMLGVGVVRHLRARSSSPPR